MSPYNAQIGGLRAGLMGTQMPSSYAPQFAPPPAPGGFQMPNNGPISSANGYLGGAFDMARSNIGGNASGPGGFKDRGTMSGQGSPY